MLSADGPYIFYNRDNTLSLLTSQAGQDTLIKAVLPAGEVGQFTCIPEETSVRPFSFSLKKLAVSPGAYSDLPARLLAISDIEGNMGAFIKLLQGNGVVDSSYRWTYGQGHLVLTGDYMDRGIDVLPCLYLIYKLEQEALQAGGQVHFILGNHEHMNLTGAAAYARPKYLELARQLNISYRELFSARTELGRWMRTKNCIEQIGDYLFVHAGISNKVADLNLSIDVMNEICRKNLHIFVDEHGDESARILLGRDGLLWYRGMAERYNGHPRQTPAEFNRIADKFGVKAIVIGHTIVGHITKEYNGRLIRIDIDHADRDPEALLIENGQCYATDIRGRLKLL